MMSFLRWLGSLFKSLIGAKSAEQDSKRADFTALVDRSIALTQSIGEQLDAANARLDQLEVRVNLADAARDECEVKRREDEKKVWRLERQLEIEQTRTAELEQRVRHLEKLLSERK